jgi:hypothetical protein
MAMGGDCSKVPRATVDVDPVDEASSLCWQAAMVENVQAKSIIRRRYLFIWRHRCRPEH